MGITVSHVIQILDGIAPPYLAESWDNPGLQLGDRSWPVHKIVLALDASTHVVSAACKEKADLLVTHHPLIFKPLRSIDLDTHVGKIVHMCMTNKMAIFAAHTNYDSVSGGVNDILARKIGLDQVRPLSPSSATRPASYKFVVFVPVEYQEKVREALFNSGCGHIGNYSGCSFSVKGCGTFYPEKGSMPFFGHPESLNKVDEVRIEALVPRESIAETIKNIKMVHPYETVAYDLYPLYSGANTEGLGRVGYLSEPFSFDAFVAMIKNRLNISTAKVTGRSDQIVERVALCSGGGSSLINHFIQSGADCYVSGDLHYHDATLIEEQGKLLVDIGHFPSEQVALDALKHQLKSIFSEREMPIEIECCDLEKDPFRYI